MKQIENKPDPSLKLRTRLHEIIFEAETPAGKWFDVILIIAIVTSVIVVFLESVKEISFHYGRILYFIEWTFTILFTIEYVLRFYTVRHSSKYALSFYGIVDLLAILPTYISLFIPGSQQLIVIRILRVLRIFRILKLSEYITEAHVLSTALKASRRKISVFLLAVITMVVIIGSLMYLIEGEKNGFTDIPTSIYWAIVTMTTVGYGDVSPHTPLGKFLAAAVMIIGYGIIAVPTGIVSAELAHSKTSKDISTEACPFCGSEGHDPDAVHCKYCGNKLN